MKPLAVILNPAAGGGRSGRRRRRLEACLKSRRLAYDLVVTRDEDHLRAAVRRCAATADWLVVAGGDTTFRIAVTEVLDAGTAGHAPRMGFYGTGSANDVTRALGIRDFRDLCRLIRRNRARPMDLGWVRTQSPPADHWFLGSLSLGLGVAVNLEMARTRGERGRSLAARAPGIAALRRAFRGNAFPREFTVNGQTGRYSLVAVMNCPYYAGGLRPARGASPFDGRLELVTLGSRGWPGTLVSGMGVLLGRELPGTAGTRFHLESPRPFRVQVDGDVIPAGRACTVEVRPGVLSVAAAG